MINYPYTSLYYATPIRVRYFDHLSEDFHYGIAYHDKVCTHTGTVTLLSTCIICALSHGIHWDDAVVECDWTDLDTLH